MLNNNTEELNINFEAVEQFKDHLEEHKELFSAADLANVAHQSNNISN